MKPRSLFSLSDSRGGGYTITTRKVDSGDFMYDSPSAADEDMVVGNFHYWSCCDLSVAVATTGVGGGDAGHGGRTTIDIKLGDCFAGEVYVGRDENGHPNLRLAIAGDVELHQITDALFNAAMFLHKASRNSDFMIEQLKNNEEAGISL